MMVKMVNKDNIRCFVTNVGTIIGDFVVNGASGDYIMLKHPFRLFPQDDGRVGVAAIFIKEEWAIIPKGMCIEIDVNDGMAMLYINYESQIYGTILAPEKKIIL
jgi:hypothetical protein